MARHADLPIALPPPDCPAAVRAADRCRAASVAVGEGGDHVVNRHAARGEGVILHPRWIRTLEHRPHALGAGLGRHPVLICHTLHNLPQRRTIPQPD